MAIWNRKAKPESQIIIQAKDGAIEIPTGEFLRQIEIQASSEGAGDKMTIDSLLEGSSINVNFPGTYNEYTTYEEQVRETYRKYNGRESFGNQQTRALIDYRSAFIAGEGLSVSCKNEATANWIEDFIHKNHFDGTSFINGVKGSEMAGQVLLVLDYQPPKKDGEEGRVRVRRVKYHQDRMFKVVYEDNIFADDIAQIQMKKDGQWEAYNVKDYIYIRTGGDDSNLYFPTTKVGVVLTDIDNYDRALKDIRRNNFVFARVTPTFEVANESEAKNLKVWLQKIQWKIGTAFIGKAKFKYESPSSSAYDNLEKELGATIKTITSTTGVPVHWLGFVDMMSNRSTAESMYETIKNATINERKAWEEGMYDTVLMAMEMHIDNGGTGVTLNKDFEIKIPLIDFNGFIDRVKALSLAYADEAISMDDYRNEIPGINPLKTAKAVEAEKKAREEEFVRMGLALENNAESEGDEEDGDTDKTDQGKEQSGNRKGLSGNKGRRPA